MCPIAEIGVFRKRVVFPATGRFDRLAPPDACRSIEIEEAARQMTSAVLDHEMAVQDHRLDLRQQGILAIDVAPSRLDHSHFCIAEIIHYIFEKARPRREVCIEDCDQFACRQFQSVLERTGFESGSVRAVDMTDVETQPTMLRHAGRRNFDGSVGGVVQNLNLQKLTRVTDPAHRFDQPLDHVHLVVYGKLNRHSRLYIEPGFRLSDFVFVFQIQVHEVIAVDSINRKNAQNREVGNEDESIEKIELV